MQKKKDKELKLKRKEEALKQQEIYAKKVQEDLKEKIDKK